MTTVSTSSLSGLFADDTNILLLSKINNVFDLKQQLTTTYEWLCCYKLSLNVIKTQYMIFTPRNKKANNINIYINDVRVYVIKFLGIQIDSQLNWETYIEHTWQKLSKCICVL